MNFDVQLLTSFSRNRTTSVVTAVCSQAGRARRGYSFFFIALLNNLDIDHDSSLGSVVPISPGMTNLETSSAPYGCATSYKDMLPPVRCLAGTLQSPYMQRSVWRTTVVLWENPRYSRVSVEQRFKHPSVRGPFSEEAHMYYFSTTGVSTVCIRQNVAT